MTEFIIGLVIGFVFGIGGFVALAWIIEQRSGLKTIVTSKDVRHG